MTCSRNRKIGDDKALRLLQTPLIIARKLAGLRRIGAQAHRVRLRYGRTTTAEPLLGRRAD